jgi:hypothetical protein
MYRRRPGGFASTSAIASSTFVKSCSAAPISGGMVSIPKRKPPMGGK